ncbi:hypothetical protein [Mesorhizobium sp. Cs1299R1N3]|uniref:hypothetical protein n=1 Tax=Mesorhizobium sp. Cs1299R1N3 TaxID=3015173 RepID=UPI00301C10A2
MTPNPSRLARCIMLAQGNHTVGVLLHSITYWAKYGKAEIPNTPGTWIANERTFWMQEACLSSDQYDRCIRSLHKWELIERRQWWFGGKNILFVRPSTITVNYLQSASTWEAAKELAPSLPATMHGSISKIAEPSSAFLPNSNEIGNCADPGTAKPLNSNNLIYSSIIDQHKTLTGEHPAAPTFAGKEKTKGSYGKSNKKQASGHQTGKKVPFPEESSMKPTVSELLAAWPQALSKHCGNHPTDQPGCPTLSPKEIGQLALFHKSLGSIPVSGGQLDLRGSAIDILDYAVRRWGEWTVGLWKAEKHEFPSAEFLHENLSAAISAWDNDGCPPRS